MSRRIKAPHSKQVKTPTIDRRSSLGASILCQWPVITNIGIDSDGNPEPTYPALTHDIGGAGIHGVASREMILVSTPFGSGWDFGSSAAANINFYVDYDGTPMKPEYLLGGENGLQNFSFSILVKFDVVNTKQVILASGGESDGFGYSIYLNSGGVLVIQTHMSATGSAMMGSKSLTAGIWYNLMFAFQRFEEEQDGFYNFAAIYINGVQDGDTDACGEWALAGASLICGKEFDSDSNNLQNAVVANITAYNRFIHPSEAAQETANLFDSSFENFSLILDAAVSDSPDRVPSGGILAGGRIPEEPPVGGGILLGGHPIEVHTIEVGGGTLGGGVALEAKEFDAQGGVSAGGLAVVTAIYTPKFSASPTSEEFTAMVGTNLGPFNDWTSPQNIAFGQDTFAFANLEDSPTAKSSLLYATDFNLSIPTGIVPLGIEVFINTNTNNAGRGVFSRIFLTKNGTNKVGTEKSDNVEIGTTQHDEIYGGSSDLWGITWTAAELNSSNFGFAIEVLSDPGSGTVQANVYQMRVQITAVDINLATTVMISGLGAAPNTFNEPVSGGILAGGVGFHSEGEVRDTSGGLLVGGEVAELMAFDPFIVGGLLVGGEVIQALGQSASGGALVGGRASTVYDEYAIGGAQLGGKGEITMHLVRGGSFGGGAAIVGIQPAVSGGIVLSGVSITGFASFGGPLIGGTVSEFVVYAGGSSSGALIGGLADVTSQEAFISTAGVLIGQTASPMAVYNTVSITGALIGGRIPEEPPIGGGILLGGLASSFVEQEPQGGMLVGGSAPGEIALVGFGGALIGGEAIAQEIQVEPVDGGMLVGGATIVEITPFHEGGILVDGITTVTAVYTVDDIGTNGALIGGRAVAGIQPPASGGILVGGEAFEFITEIGTGGALIGGNARQTFYEEALGGAVLGGLAESSIDYSGHGGALIGSIALVSDEIIKHPNGGALIGGIALVSDEITKHPDGGVLVNSFALLHYSFIGGVNFDDTVSYGGPVTIGGVATVIRPTIKFIGNGPVVISGEADTSFVISDFSFESQATVSTPVAVQGSATIILALNDQECFTPNKPCHISDRQTGQKRVHCTVPELFTPYCRDLRKGNQCSGDAALLPAIIACRQKLLQQQQILDIKNKTTLRNRGNVI